MAIEKTVEIPEKLLQAENITYDDTNSGLGAETTQEAIEALSANVKEKHSETATKLANSRTIDGVSFNGTANVKHYAKCTTSGATAEKTVYVDNFVLAEGARVIVYFYEGNSAKSPTLNVSNTGAAPILYRGVELGNNGAPEDIITYYGTYEFVYMGAVWALVGEYSQNSINAIWDRMGTSTLFKNHGYNTLADAINAAFNKLGSTAIGKTITQAIYDLMAKMGTTDISSIGDGKITGAISAIGASTYGFPTPNADCVTSAAEEVGWRKIGKIVYVHGFFDLSTELAWNSNTTILSGLPIPMTEIAAGGNYLNAVLKDYHTCYALKINRDGSIAPSYLNNLPAGRYFISTTYFAKE